MRILALSMLLLCTAPAAAQTPVRAGALRAAAESVTVELNGVVTARVLALESPLRLVVDLGGVDAARATAAGGGAVMLARIGPFDPATARLVIALRRPMRIAVAVQDRDFGLTLKLVPASAADFTAAAKSGRRPLTVIQTKPAAPPRPPGGNIPNAGDPGGPVVTPDFDLPADVFGPPPAATTPAPPRPAPPKDDRPRTRPGVKPLVVIDAGHGGKDVGAIAVDGGYEKNVTLAIARAAARALERGGKVRVHLTRGDDRFIPLGGRVTIARSKRADLFISVHADAAPNALARGATVYTLSEVASDAAAARLAARENRADIIAGVNLGVEAPEVEGILLDLLRRSTLNGAAAFADLLQDELDDDIGFRKNFRGFAGFRVLKATEIPSVLLETGYVSNSEDAEMLFSRTGQRKIGEGIARAVEAYFRR
ncbi:N-acetylmuramoyl-L-alanine amidase [Glacieibacterium frigidum]|uniref:N-acetylmuramoyl-L-alanine amidase n=1 Tax=Glacieibacterium frigidum TaxID=2593303 RepID=A0A552UFQ0_9SPHN|nr:N-acetylmuramoyl-L-alanine amidase [Glacieibacterium frigidum]TRW17048.1 N-acetylmuramoyl-L-alanine amidase [Glacieibacterium frigidum]